MRAGDRRLRPAPAARHVVRPLSRPALLLWDVDGTLVGGANVEHQAALRVAVERAAGRAADEGGLQMAGRTDPAIARELLERAGLEREEAAAALPGVLAAWQAEYERAELGDLRRTVLAGVPEALDRAAGLRDAVCALLTGNLEPIAWRKLGAAGLAERFARGQGAFGSDAEEREALPAIARRRAGNPPRERTVVIGDTPRDIACARAGGVRCVAVASGPYGLEALHEADAAVADAAGLPGALAELLR